MPVIDLKFGCACNGCGGWFPAGAPLMWPSRLCFKCQARETEEMRAAWLKIAAHPPAGVKVYVLRQLPTKVHVSKFANMPVIHAMDVLKRKADQLDRNVLKTQLLDRCCPPTPAALKREGPAFGL